MTLSPARAPVADGALRAALAGALRRPRYEVLPLPGTADHCAAHLPSGVPVTVTASPRRGLESTMQLSETLAAAGFRAVPHLAARMVRDEAHLTELLARAGSAGVQDVFVIGGDADEPAGRFADACGLLAALRRLRESGVAHSVTGVGVAGYPEGHPRVGEAALLQALLAKQPLSTYVVTQMCFDPAAISDWVSAVRWSGVRLPVHVGVAGPVDRRRLLAVAARIGVGTSVRYLRRQRGGARLLRRGGYRPDRLVGELATELAQQRVAGLHLYTMGDLTGTEHWRLAMLDRIDQEQDDA